jgi:hypothetical protein
MFFGTDGRDELNLGPLIKVCVSFRDQVQEGRALIRLRRNALGIWKNLEEPYSHLPDDDASSWRACGKGYATRNQMCNGSNTSKAPR